MTTALPTQSSHTSRDSLTVANLGLAHRIASPFMLRFPSDRDDLRQIAYLALMRAAEHFEPSRGWRFSTLACCYIWRDLQNWVRSQRNRVVKHSLTMDAQARLLAKRSRQGDYLSRRLLWRALWRLSPRHRQWIRRHYFNGETRREIAESEGLKPASVGHGLRKALRALRGMLPEESHFNLANTEDE